MNTKQKKVFWTVAAVCALTRFVAMARSMWDWDEALFCLGMRGYDVTLHHPHPPGFPVYIGMAKVLRFVISSDFRSLQALNLIAGMLVFPAVFLLARELRLNFETSLGAGVLFAFFPNVWFFGGTAFSDVPSIVLVLFAAIFLLRGRESARDYLIGTFLLALAIGIRPQNILIGLFPGILATLRRRPREILAALLIGVAVVGAAYGAAIHATGTYAAFMSTVRGHAEYIARVDSFQAAGRPPLLRLFDRFFIRQYQSTPLSMITSIFVIISIVGAIRSRDRGLLYNALIFGPFALAAWLMLDRYSISRFSIGYLPMFAIFAADGIARASRGRRAVEGAIFAALVAGFVVFTAPALSAVRDEVAPSVLGVEAAVRTVNPRTGHLFVGYEMTPFIEYLAPSFPITRVMDDRAMPLTPAPNSYLLAEVSQPRSAGGQMFVRERSRLRNIARRHYFEVALKPLTALPQFGEGWYPPEQEGMDERRWMSGHSVTTLPPVSGETLLRLRFSVSDELLAKSPNVSVILNGKTLERIAMTPGEIERDYHVTPIEGPNVLELSTDQTFHDPTTTHDLGLRVRFISWGPE